MTRARNPCYLTNIFTIIGQFSRADWLRAVIDKCKSDGNDEIMAQFIFSFSLARFFSLTSTEIDLNKKCQCYCKNNNDNHGPLYINLLTI